MKIPAKEIPQADSLDTLERAIRAVSEGASTYQDIANTLGYDERQGRYYRMAGEILGLLEKPARNQSRTTSLGNAFLTAHGIEKVELLAVALMNSRLFQRIVTFLQSAASNGVTRSEIEEFVGNLTETTPNMVERRVSTIISWLRAARLMGEQYGRFVFLSFPDRMPIVNCAVVDEPLLPNRFTLTEYEAVAERTRSARGSITYEIDRAKLDRANSMHETLTRLVASKIRAAGGVPKRNPLIDLAAKVGAETFIFEIKTTPPRSFRGQVRRGISQLYEYRYLQNVPDAKLVLVTEQPFPAGLQWMGDYLARDRGILFAWDGDSETLHCSSDIRHSLGFLL